MKFIEFLPERLKSANPFARIGKDWMLITAGTEKSFNTMTASWGTMGVLWGRNIVTAFVRPQRYTFEFLEKNDFFTLSFFADSYKKELVFCGRNSGRDVNKVKESGFTPCFDEKSPYFEQAELVLICKKIYTQFIDPNCFEESSLQDNYENEDYHKAYVGEIIKCMIKEEK